MSVHTKHSALVAPSPALHVQATLHVHEVV